ncbi:Mannose-1-phosphate guanylyltransferase RfbM [Marinomonas aquimarina]|uniref:Mannose-1-phosphate guanylyltransferase RfbM n=1 Tax=Marinomonas aquimarina TaxID=295068 RepID=A0A1A8T4G4_9GAMM|nr:mannose-1-phosphate guanylyltransferase [Marinomonas aquimarina]SBS25746.1 Mannose-1-phosphate guanylyltransferase RfbM [Marinomonas aquimarina]
MFIPVILAGGSGTRLAPISTTKHPKPFIDLLDCGYTLFELTLLRAQQTSDKRPIVVVAKEHLAFVQQALHKLSMTAHILLEPCGRNTAPAMTCAALFAQHIYPDDSPLLVLAADHYIADPSYFCQRVVAAHDAAMNDQLVLFGIRPTYPETGYGYIEVGQDAQIHAFHEKPDQHTAMNYLARGNYLWNSGFFVLPRKILLAEIEHFAPKILASCHDAVTQSVQLSERTHLLSPSFAEAPAISIDYAIMEHSAKLALCEYASEWSDLGTWPALYRLWPKDEQGIAHHLALALALMPTASGLQLMKDNTWIADV